MGLINVELFLLVSFIASGFSLRISSRYVRDSSPKGEPLDHLKEIHSDLMPFLAPSLPSWKHEVPSRPPARTVPESLVASSSHDLKHIFKPEKGARPLPQSVKDMLLVTAPPDTPRDKRLFANPIEVRCLDNEMVVNVRKDVLKSLANLDLKLGLCPSTSDDDEYYHFKYGYHLPCGFIRQPTADYMYVSTALIYNPPGPVIREVGFNIPIKCILPRFFHSYKVGYYPELQGGTVRKPLTPRTAFSIVPQDAVGATITGGTSYTLGERMYFEVRRPLVTTVDPTKRLYINQCFITATPSPSSALKHMVIDNQGCMVDSKATLSSKFLTGSSKMVQRFSVAALVFKELALMSSSQQLFMHCEISIAPIMATKSFKACNYDHGAQIWQELYGYHHTCACCDDSCPAGLVKASHNVVSSKSWKVNFKVEDGQTEPQRTSLEEQKSAEVPDQKGFINYWDHDDDDNDVEPLPK